MKLDTTVTDKRIINRFKLHNEEVEVLLKNTAVVHKDTLYTGATSKLTFYCRLHGYFLQSIHTIRKGSNCPKCGYARHAARRKPIEVRIVEFNKVHNNFYSYPNTSLPKNPKNKISIVCPIHGEFQQVMYEHARGKGCSTCGMLTKSLTTEKFIEKAKKVHNSTYTYAYTTYISSTKKLMITCPVHGNFTQKASSHLEGSGCSACAVSGFSTAKPAILYYFKFLAKGKFYYKLGVTNLTINKRYRKCDRDRIVHSSVKIEKFTKGQDAYDKEQMLLRVYKNSKYTKDITLLESVKNTEIFTKNIIKGEL